MVEKDITRHYGAGQENELFDRLVAALRRAGLDPESITVADLAPLDHFHGRGLEATRELADRLPVQRGAELLDIGSGIGGPARYYAERFGCGVTGVDLTQAFCDTATRLTALVGLQDRVRFKQGGATDLPFPDACFDGAISLNVLMNIADKARFYAEAFRVLKPGGFLALTEAALGTGQPTFPVPWATTAETSFLVTPDESIRLAEAAGFERVDQVDTTPAARAFADRARTALKASGPPVLGTHVLMGGEAKAKARNASRSIAEGQTIPLETICWKP